ncbi:Putative glycoside hydrolase family 65, glycoside hydrolase, family 65, central catalytic [Septoria linicola]|uniref:alpha,alpha-trehalase n=1 Tax=Septoria linicola TaxID=215465 RepID=A0A9Q9B0M0_9PEZI|nr:putative glycoside hydrolase family 65, glycoside hydrolase, family 65, central catalytic [Septoria linicola]USW55438.1 Putative glycoside hydrolase family 65, glycoside hydrolase, family 65, central catalytic [Septoria linicola]
MHWRLFGALAALLGPTNAHIYDTRFNGTTWNDDAWSITTTTLDQGHYQSRMSLANGYFGINVAAVGPFFDVDVQVNGDNIQGWPLFDRRQSFATIAGFWDSQPTTNGTNFGWLNQYGGESVISGVPHWAGLHVQVGDDLLDASVPAEQISNFSSTLDMKNGIIYWNYTWTPVGGAAIGVEYSLFVHKLHVNQAAVQLRLTAAQDVKATVIDLLQGDCAVRSTPVETGSYPVWPIIWSAVSPDGIRNVTAWIFSSLVGDDSFDASSRKNITEGEILGGNSSSIAQSVDVSLSGGCTSVITKFVGAASNDAFADAASTALNASWHGANSGFADLYATHKQEWNDILTKDSVDDFRDAEGKLPDDLDVQELQITAITNPFQLLQNTVSKNAVLVAENNTKLASNSISVCGLGGSCYAGLVFWDTEVWMQPGLVVSFPDAAKQIAQYRVDRGPQAHENILTAYQSSQNETGKFSRQGAAYSWTSGRYGNCTGTGPCFDYQYHLNGDIGLEFFNYWAVTADTDYFRSELFPIYEAFAQLYADLVTFNETTGLYELYNATDPDEYANFQKNVGFTMLLMQSHINETNTIRERFGLERNETWQNISNQITIPVSEEANIILEYASQNGSITVKQADIVLIDDFLQWPNPYTLSNLDYYAAAQSPDGPAMTYGVFSVVANRESPSGCSSYTYDLYGSQPYTRGPWFQFSEQLIDDWSANGGTHPAFPFLTGVGGAHRVAVFGYLGLRLMIDKLNIDPSLPPQIPQLAFRTIYWQGWPVKAVSNQTHTTLTRSGEPLSTANSTFADSAIPVTISIEGTEVHELAPNGMITIENRQIGLVKTVPGNIAQCRPASSEQDYEPGQFPLSAVDGAVSTKWQPSFANTTSSLTVELPQPFVPITQIQFDWAQAPPTSYRVTFHNLSDTSDVPPVNVTSSDNVEVSDPYNAGAADVIRPYSSNTTNVTLDQPVWSARYATLEILGSHANDGSENETNGTGASVAEFAVVAGNGENIAARSERAWLA